MPRRRRTKLRINAEQLPLGVPKIGSEVMASFPRIEVDEIPKQPVSIRKALGQTPKQRAIKLLKRLPRPQRPVERSIVTGRQLRGIISPTPIQITSAAPTVRPKIVLSRASKKEKKLGTPSKVLLALTGLGFTPLLLLAYRFFNWPAGGETFVSLDMGVPTTALYGRQINFSVNAHGGTPPYVFKWDFGDGSTQIGRLVSHTYTERSAAITVTITCTAEDSFGYSGTGTAQLILTVLPVPIITPPATGPPGPGSPQGSLVPTGASTASLANGVTQYWGVYLPGNLGKWGVYWDGGGGIVLISIANSEDAAKTYSDWYNKTLNRNSTVKVITTPTSIILISKADSQTAAQAYADNYNNNPATSGRGVYIQEVKIYPLKIAAQKAVNESVNSCMAYLAQFNIDVGDATLYCSNARLGVGSL